MSNTQTDEYWYPEVRSSNEVSKVAIVTYKYDVLTIRPGEECDDVWLARAVGYRVVLGRRNNRR